MSALPRKQREFRKREQLILDTASTILHRQGYMALTMDRVAEAVEYSKGTIYNHFSSKEDLICSLCCRCVSQLLELFQRAVAYHGSTRERYSAIGIAYSLYYMLNPLDAQNIQTIRTSAVREKLSRQKLQELETLEHQAIAINRELVMEAIQRGDLPGPDPSVADSIVFGCWSMCYGSLLLEQSDIPLNDLGFSPRAKMTWNNTQKFLDGFRWKPLSTEIDTDQLFEKLCEEIFPEETAVLKNRE